MVVGDLRILTPPIFGVSKAGWTLEGDDIRDLFVAAPNDDLTDWQDMVIYDADSKRWCAQEVWRTWPQSRLGLAVCRAFRVCSHLEVKLSAPEIYSEAELRNRIVATLGPQSVGSQAKSVKDILAHL